MGFGPQDFMWLEQNYPIGVFEDIIYEGGDPAGDDLAMLTPEEGEDLAMMSAFSAWVTFELNKSLEESERLDNNFWLRERYFELKQMAYKRYLQAMYREEYLDDVSDSIDDLEYWVGNQWDIFSEKFENKNKDLRSDLAMMIERKGGIDLRADQADIQIFESENGFKFPKIDPAMLKGMDLNFAPVIIRIKPVSVSQARMLLGLNAEDTKDSRDAAQPRDKAREIEVSAL